MLEFEVDIWIVEYCGLNSGMFLYIHVHVNNLICTFLCTDFCCNHHKCLPACPPDCLFCTYMCIHVYTDIILSPPPSDCFTRPTCTCTCIMYQV